MDVVHTTGFVRGPGVVVGAVALLLAGCSPTSAPDRTPPASTAPASTAPTGAAPTGAATGLTADLVQQRPDVELGQIQVELTLDADAAALQVTGLQLRSGAFPAAEPGERAVEGLGLGPGTAVDLPVVLGEPAACTPEESRDPSGEDASPLPAVAVLALGDGSAAEVPLPDAHRHLARAHAEACTSAAARAVVPTGWDPTWTTTGSGADLRAVGVLHLGPVAAGRTAALAAIGDTPLFRWQLPDGSVRLVAGQSADVTVVLEPARCDPHAVAEDKRGFGPQLQLVLDGAPAVPVRVWVPRSERAVATDALVAACAQRP